MSESDFDIDTMGKLTLDYFERDSSCSGESANGSSPSYSNDYLESPVSSPDERSTPESLSDSSSMYSEEEPPERVLSRKGKMKRSVGVKETVSKRNARERKRVKLISEGFSTLRKHVLVQPNNRKLPKLEILRRAIDYIHGLQSMLDESDVQLEMENQMRKTENQCHVQPTQIHYLFSAINEPGSVQPSYVPEFQPYVERIASNQQGLTTSSSDNRWLHAGYSQ